MEKIDTHPCSPAQRKMGWDESFEWNGRQWPAAWEIHPTSDVFAIGARSAEVCPVYWEKDGQRGVDWWVFKQTNNASPSVLMFEVDVWNKADTPDGVLKMIEHWHWDIDCKDHADLQIQSMKDAHKIWVEEPVFNKDVVVIPSSAIYNQWSINLYAPVVLLGEETDMYPGALQDVSCRNEQTSGAIRSPRFG